MNNCRVSTEESLNDKTDPFMEIDHKNRLEEIKERMIQSDVEVMDLLEHEATAFLIRNIIEGDEEAGRDFKKFLEGRLEVLAELEI